MGFQGGNGGNFGIFLTVALALALGFTKLEAVAIGVVDQAPGGLGNGRSDELAGG